MIQEANYKLIKLKTISEYVSLLKKKNQFYDALSLTNSLLNGTKVRLAETEYFINSANKKKVKGSEINLNN